MTNTQNKIDQAMDNLSETEQARRGGLAARVLRLKRAALVGRDRDDRWRTEWGTKTDLGLFRTIERIVKEGK